MNILIQANGFQFEIRNEEDPEMEGSYLVIEFEDGYQLRLVDNYGWDKVTAEEKVDVVIHKELIANGLDCELHWEDREVFLLEGEGIEIKNVAKALLSLFPDSRKLLT